jgi:hypothetical protein
MTYKKGPFMIERSLAWTAAVTASIAILLVIERPAAGQSTSSVSKVSAVKASNIPRMPDGHPSFSGIWTDRTLTPLERRKELGAKEFYTDEEFAKMSAMLAQGKLPEGFMPPRTGGETSVQYNQELYGFDITKSPLASTKRTSLIVGPEGVVPPMLPEATQRNAKRAAELKGHETDTYKNRSLSERCIVGGLVMLPMIPSAADQNTLFQIVQGPGYVGIYQEENHETRVIPTDGRPHVPQTIRQWQGESVGRWEGDTLVIDTTNFTGQTAFRGSSEALHLVERLTRFSEDTILYRFTVEDPKTWATPWTAEVPWTKSDRKLFEYACQEGNSDLPTILRGARTQEAEAAKNRQ